MNLKASIQNEEWRRSMILHLLDCVAILNRNKIVPTLKKMINNNNDDDDSKTKGKMLEMFKEYEIKTI